jgi:glucokinase
VEKGGVFSFSALQAALEKEFDVATLVEHDATAGALGEKWMGIGLSSEAEDIVYICSDSSCGLILNGEIYYGASKSAGELNINPPPPDSKDEKCWAKYDHGCALRSRGIDLGIVSKVKEHMKNNPKAGSKIRELCGGSIEKVTLTIVAAAAKMQDDTAIKFMEEAGEYLGTKMAFLINLFNPDSLVIGRGIEICGEAFMDAVRAGVKKWAYEESVKVARIIPTTLGEDSVACGASALVMQQVFARVE